MSAKLNSKKCCSPVIIFKSLPGLTLPLFLFFFQLNSFAQNTDQFFVLENIIDSIIKEGLDSQAYPGAQLLIAKDGTIILSKTYGYHTYKKTNPVKKDDLYDLASITKVTTGLPILMQLYGEDKFNLDASLKTYFPNYFYWNF
ncbi:MAG: serine hydrolase domain-containing protein [Bacteroidota bacterium]